MFIKVIRLIERWNNGDKNYYLNEITLNADHIAFLTENYEMKSLLREGKFNLNIHPQADFTDIKLSSGKEITVVGNTSTIETKISKSSKKLLRD
tara:strand:- start:284 stop:565 length:282 start_codon:yes stop_codon:yes gene_type:complete